MRSFDEAGKREKPMYNNGTAVIRYLSMDHLNQNDLIAQRPIEKYKKTFLALTLGAVAASIWGLKPLFGKK